MPQMNDKEDAGAIVQLNSTNHRDQLVEMEELIKSMDLENLEATAKDKGFDELKFMSHAINFDSNAPP